MRALQFVLSTAVLSAAILFPTAAPAANAATVTLGLISRQIAPGDAAGDWELWAWTSAADNNGIAAYYIDITGDDLFAEQLPPIVVAEILVPSGFTVNGFGIPECGCSALFAGHAPHPGGQLFGVGSPDVPERIPPPPPYIPEASTNAEWWMNEAFVSSATPPEHPFPGDNPFQVPARSVQLAYGMISRFDQLDFGIEAIVFVWDLGGRTRAMDADVVRLVDHVPAVPEPRASKNALILLLGVFTALSHSRRRFE